MDHPVYNRGVYSSGSLNCFPHEHFHPWISFHIFSNSENSPDHPYNCFYCNFKQQYIEILPGAHTTRLDQLNKISALKQYCWGNDSNTKFSMRRNIGISAEIPCILAYTWAERTNLAVIIKIVYKLSWFDHNTGLSTRRWKEDLLIFVSSF